MKIELRPGQTYLAGDQLVTFVSLEKKGLKRVARVIPQTEHNPTEGEPVQTKLLSPKELREVPNPLPAGKQSAILSLS